MKKRNKTWNFFAASLFLLFASVFSLQAQTTYTFANYPQGVQYAVNEEHILDENVTLYTTSCHFREEIRVYSSATNDGFFVSNALPFYIDSLAFNLGYKADEVNIYGSNNGSDWSLVGTILTTTNYTNKGLDFGSNNYVMFKFDVAGTQQVRVKTMTIFYKTSGPSGTMAAAPIATPEGGIRTSLTEVSLTSETSGASIYYTLDGTNPDSTSTLYTSPIRLANPNNPVGQYDTAGYNVIVKAIAYAAGSSPSLITTNEYVFPYEVANIAAFKANGNSGEVYRITGDLTFVFYSGSAPEGNAQTASNSTYYTYLKDDSGYMMVYDNTGILSHNYTEGDVISGGIIGSFDNYYGQIEFKPLMDMPASTTNTGTVTPEIATINDIVTNYEQYESKLVTFQNVELRVSANSEGGLVLRINNGTDSIEIYDRFRTLENIYNSELLQPGNVYENVSVTGFVSTYNTKREIFPRTEADFNFDGNIEAPEFTISGDSADNGAYLFSAQVSITHNDVNAEIYYTIDGSEPDTTSASTITYTAPFTVNSTTTINAIAVVDGNVSSVASQLVTIFIPTVSTPIFTPMGGTATESVVFADSVTVTLACETENAEIRYTLNGDEPTSTSTLYENPIQLTTTTVIKAKAFKDMWNSSEVAEAHYTISNTPVLAVAASTTTLNAQNNTTILTISAAHLTDSITLVSDNEHFTLSNTQLAPTNGVSTITVTFDALTSASCNVTVSSGSLSQTVALVGIATLPAPTFTPATGTTDTAITVTIACAVADAEIRYTINNGDTLTYNSPFVLNTEGVYNIEAIAYKTGWDHSATTSATYTIFVPVLTDTIIYATGFEVSEGFVTSQTYNNVEAVYNGPEDAKWGIVFGTVSTTSYITDASSLQMRWYTSNPNSLGYAYTNFDLAHASRVTFYAKNTNGLKVAVSHSTDGGNIYSTPVVYDLTSNAAQYEYTISEDAAFDFVRLKFDLVLPTEVPTSTSRLIIDSVCVYGFPDMEFSLVQNPVIAPNSGNVFEPTEVSITCATEDAQIYYTTDGTEPDSLSTLYTVPFMVSQTTTIKAKAFKADLMPSAVVSATYNFPVPVANIAAFKAANSETNNTVYELTGDLIFVYKNGANIFLQDSTGSLLVYDNAPIISGDYNEGDVIRGGVYGTYKLYNNLSEMIPVRDFPEADGNIGTVLPTVTSAFEIGENYEAFESKLVKLEDVVFEGGSFVDEQASTINFMHGDETMACRSYFKNLSMTIPQGTHADLTGFVLIYNDTIQIAPRNNADIQVIILEQVETPIITLVGTETVSITCATDEAQIYYTLDGTTPDETSNLYTGDFDLVEGNWTVKAIAVKEGMQNSEIAELQVQVSIEEYLDAIISIYPNPVDNQLWINCGDVMMQNIAIYSAFGQSMNTFAIDATQVMVDMDELSAGVYFINIVTEKGNVVKKIIKR